MGKIYIFNTAIIPVDFSEKEKYCVVLKRITIEEAKEILSEGEIISAIGHESTSSLLSELLGIHIPYNRINVKMKSQDKGIHFVLRQRLPEGTVLDKKELERLEFDLVYSEVF
ncbi:MAG: DUF1874 domain-containing protein [Caldimicrobium sp.]|nr:DUF1874 domain-containing protein [Caldimicrobium sp.]